LLFLRIYLPNRSHVGEQVGKLLKASPHNDAKSNFPFSRPLPSERRVLNFIYRTHSNFVTTWLQRLLRCGRKWTGVTEFNA
jgi:hypothetical protein